MHILKTLFYLYFKMGLSSSKETQFKWLDKYELIDVNNNDKILKLMSKVSQQQYIGKQYFCYSDSQARQLSKFIHTKILNPCPYLMQLIKVGIKNGEAYCGRPTIFYLVFQKPFQTLKEETIQRKIKRIEYSQVQLNLLLQSCVKSLYYLREIKSFHETVSSSNIFIKEDRTIILGDPWLNEQFTKEGQKYIKVVNSTIYPSPEKILFSNSFISTYDKTLSDIFTLGIVILEIIYFYNMDCLYESNFRRIISSQIVEKISNIKYPDLKNKLKIILSQEPSRRRQIFKIFNCKQSIKTMLSQKQKVQQMKVIPKEMMDDIGVSQVKTVKKRHNNQKSVDSSIIYKISDSRHPSQNSILNNHPQKQYYPSTTINNPTIYQSSINHQPLIHHQQPLNYHPPIHHYPNHSLLEHSTPIASIRGHKIMNYIRPPLGQTVKVVNTIKVVQVDHIKELQSKKISQEGIERNVVQNESLAKMQQIKEKLILGAQSQKIQLSSIDKDSLRESCQDIISNMQMINQQLKHNKTSPKEAHNHILNQIKPFDLMQDKLANREQQKLIDQLKKQREMTQKREGQGQVTYNKVNEYNRKYKKYSNSNETIREMSDESPSKDQIDKAGQYNLDSKYKGELKNGQKNGFGVFTYQNGSIYKGQWKQNKMHGKGNLFNSNRSLIYQGSWNMDCFHGYGVLHNEKPIQFVQPYDYQNLSQIQSLWESYEGEFLSDARHGRGKLKLTNGQIFIGQFKDNAIQGDGRYYRIDGKIIMGRWQKNKLIARQ